MYNAPEVVVELQVGGRAGGLVHGADDVGAFLVFTAEEAVEDFAERANVVQIIKDDDAGQLARRRALALVRDVRQVCTQLLARLVVHVKRSDGARCQVFARSGN